MTDFFDRSGNPIELLEWARMVENREYAQVREDIVGDIRVSTVWLGFNQSLSRDPGPFHIFETATLSVPNNELIAIAGRTSTEAEAIAMHENILAFVKLGHPFD